MKIAISAVIFLVIIYCFMYWDKLFPKSDSSDDLDLINQSKIDEIDDEIDTLVDELNNDLAGKIPMNEAIKMYDRINELQKLRKRYTG